MLYEFYLNKIKRKKHTNINLTQLLSQRNCESIKIKSTSTALVTSLRHVPYRTRAKELTLKETASWRRWHLSQSKEDQKEKNLKKRIVIFALSTSGVPCEIHGKKNEKENTF